MLQRSWAKLRRSKAALSLAGRSNTSSAFARPTPLQRGMLSAAVSSAGLAVVSSFARHSLTAAGCLLIALAQRCRAAEEALRAHHLAELAAAPKLTTSLFMHVLPGSFQAIASGILRVHFNVHHRQSVLLRVHKRPLSAASVTTAHRVNGKWPWPPLWPANQPSGAEVPGCERRIIVLGLEISLPVLWEVGCPGDLRSDSNSNRCSRAWAIAAGVHKPPTASSRIRVICGYSSRDSSAAFTSQRQPAGQLNPTSKTSEHACDLTSQICGPYKDADAGGAGVRQSRHSENFTSRYAETHHRFRSSARSECAAYSAGVLSSLESRQKQYRQCRQSMQHTTSKNRVAGLDA